MTRRDPFQSAKHRLRRAKSHAKRFHARLMRFLEDGPYTIVADLDDDGKSATIKFVGSKPIPESAIGLAAEAIEGFRAALDHTGYAAGVAAKTVNPKSKRIPATKFPFGRTRRDVVNNLARGSRSLPPEIQKLFLSFKPYKRGNEFLWALNQLCNTQKHAILVPAAPVVPSFEEYQALGGTFKRMPYRWNGDKGEAVLARVTGVTHGHLNGIFSGHIAFQLVGAMQREPAVTFLYTCASEIERIIEATEAECRSRGWI